MMFQNILESIWQQHNDSRQTVTLTLPIFHIVIVLKELPSSMINIWHLKKQVMFSLTLIVGPKVNRFSQKVLSDNIDVPFSFCQIYRLFVCYNDCT